MVPWHSTGERTRETCAPWHFLLILVVVKSYLYYCCSFNLFADDMLLNRTIGSSEDLQQIQSDVDRVNEWVISNHLSLNPVKCKTMLITKKINPIQPPQLQLNGILLNRWNILNIWEFFSPLICPGRPILIPFVPKHANSLDYFTGDSLPMSIANHY